MQSTTETRLKLEHGQAELLDQMAAHYGRYKRKLYAWIAAHGRNAKAHKTAFCRAHGLSSRMFNALAVEVQGGIDAVRELLKNDKTELQQAIARTRTRLEKRRKQRLDIEEDRLRCSPTREARIRKSIYEANCKLQKLKSKLDCVFRTKPDTDFAASWTGVSREGGHGFHGKLDSDFTRSWTVTL